MSTWLRSHNCMLDVENRDCRREWTRPELAGRVLGQGLPREAETYGGPSLAGQRRRDGPHDIGFFQRFKEPFDGF